MKGSFVKRNINPKSPSYLSGQINRIIKHTGILDSIYCTVLILEQFETKLCFLFYDVLQFDEYVSNKIRFNVGKAIELNQNNIYTIPSHTHAGPEILKDGLFGIKTDSTVADGYLEYLVEVSVDAAHQANQTQVECSIEYAEIEIEGYYGNRNDIEKLSDKSIRFLLFKDDAKTVGLFVNLACHPTILGAQNTLISADLFGKLRSELELRYQCPVIVSNGAEGDMSNRNYRQSSDQIELERIGNGILKQIPHQLNTRTLTIKQINIYRKTFLFNCSIDKHRILNAINQNNLHIVNNQLDDAQNLLRATNKVLYHRLVSTIEPVLSIEYTIINLGSIIILTIPLELFSSLYLRLSDAITIPVIVLGLTNISMGYCVDREAYTTTYEGLTSIFNIGEGERFIQSIIDEIKHNCSMI